MGQENRKHFRSSYVEEITMITSEEKTYEAQSENLSLGGIFVLKQDPLPPGTKGLLNLTVNVEGVKKKISAKFNVIHNQLSQKGSVGMGLEFIGLSEEDKAVLRKVIG